MITGKLFLAFLLSLIPAVVFAAPVGIHVVDDATERGIPMVEIRLSNGVSLLTDSAGWAAMDEPSLEDQPLYVQATSPSYALPKDEHGLPALVIRANTTQPAILRMVRLNIAERLYRITGADPYRDSHVLGKDELLPRLDLGVAICQMSGTQAFPFNGRVRWIWNHVQLSGAPTSLSFPVGAWSDLPGQKSLDPTVGVHFQYDVDDRALKSLLPLDESGDVEIEGLVSVPDTAGVPHLMAHYIIHRGRDQRAEHGLAEMNDIGVFERIALLGPEYEWQFPQGHAEVLTEKATTWVYFGNPFCTVRAPASYEAIRSPASYQALGDAGDGKPVWQQAKGPQQFKDEANALKSGSIRKSQARLTLVDAEQRNSVELVNGTTRWSSARQRFVVLGSDRSGAVYYAEGSSIIGPWWRAVKVLDACGNGPAEVTHHSFFDQPDGSLFFECGHHKTGTPRYEGCLLMYRLNLNDARLGAAQRQ